MSKCNYCWQDMQGDSSVAPCGHVFCADHAEAMLEQGEGCLVCGSSVAHSTLKVVPLEPPPSLLEVRGRRRRSALDFASRQPHTRAC
jgi:hypothetical protein